MGCKILPLWRAKSYPMMCKMGRSWRLAVEFWRSSDCITQAAITLSCLHSETTDRQTDTNTHTNTHTRTYTLTHTHTHTHTRVHTHTHTHTYTHTYTHTLTHTRTHTHIYTHTHTHTHTHTWWWLFPRVRGFGENVRQFILRLCFFIYLFIYFFVKWRSASAH